MVSRLLLVVSLGCCAVLVGSFAWFARDQLNTASIHQQHVLANQAGQDLALTPTPEREVGLRRTLDAADARLTAPFRSLITSSSAWVVRGGMTLIGLLVWGLGLCFVANFARGSTHPLGRRRTAGG